MASKEVVGKEERKERWKEEDGGWREGRRVAARCGCRRAAARCRTHVVVVGGGGEEGVADWGRGQRTVMGEDASDPARRPILWRGRQHDMTRAYPRSTMEQPPRRSRRTSRPAARLTVSPSCVTSSLAILRGMSCERRVTRAGEGDGGPERVVERPWADWMASWRRG